MLCLRFSEHLMAYGVSGIGQGRVTNNLGTFVNQLDGSLTIADEKSIAMVYDLLDTEGIYIGASSALNVVAAVELAQKLGPGTYFSSLDDFTVTYASVDRPYNLNYLVRRCIQIPEPFVLEEVATDQGARKRNTRASQEVRCTRVVPYRLHCYCIYHIINQFEGKQV